MTKIAIVINGKPGSGKDTLCDAAIQKYRARKISSIDPIAALARQGGWDGVKDAKSRKLLSDLKRVFAEFNDLSNQYVLREYQSFLESGDEILFIHIREQDQIEAFKAVAADRCVTLLVRRPGTYGRVGNSSDDEVDQFSYDVIFDNDQPQPEAEKAFCALIGYIHSRHA
ncbi:MAG: hypothetical protein LBI19_02505 [Oscillospiraceae bacterium]|jgi:dephospho-CoA kinase|nr:hypothetical protein [Oscillospiraceae bacterium]